MPPSDLLMSSVVSGVICVCLPELLYVQNRGMLVCSVARVVMLTNITNIPMTSQARSPRPSSSKSATVIPSQGSQRRRTAIRTIIRLGRSWGGVEGGVVWCLPGRS